MSLPLLSTQPARASAGEIGDARGVSVHLLLLLRVVLQTVQRAHLLLQGLLKVRNQNVRVLDRLPKPLDIGLDQVAKLLKSFELIVAYSVLRIAALDVASTTKQRIWGL